MLLIHVANVVFRNMSCYIVFDLLAILIFI